MPFEEGVRPILWHVATGLASTLMGLREYSECESILILREAFEVQRKVYLPFFSKETLVTLRIVTVDYCWVINPALLAHSLKKVQSCYCYVFPLHQRPPFFSAFFRFVLLLVGIGHFPPVVLRKPWHAAVAT